MSSDKEKAQTKKKTQFITPENSSNPLQLLRWPLAASLASSLLGKKVLMDVGEDTTLGDGDVSEKLVQFLVVAWVRSQK